jgi:hypothetical protein
MDMQKRTDCSGGVNEQLVMARGRAEGAFRLPVQFGRGMWRKEVWQMRMESEDNRAEKAEDIRTPRYPTDTGRAVTGYMNICIACKNYCGGCSWSSTFTPVDGWDAEETNLHIQKGRWIKTYKIKGCPEYEEDHFENPFADMSIDRQADLIVKYMVRFRGVKAVKGGYEVHHKRICYGKYPTFRAAVKRKLYLEAKSNGDAD